MNKAAMAACLSMCPYVVVACPTAADLEDGIVIVSGKPGAPITHVIRRVAGDLVWNSQYSAMFPDAWSSYSHAGLFELFTHRESGSGQKVARYDPPLPPMDSFVPGTVFKARTSWGDADGTQEWNGMLTYEVTESGSIQIGACSYESVRIKVHGLLTYPDGQTKMYDRTKVLIPELAFETGYSETRSVEKAGWFTAVKTDRAMVKQAATMPDLAAILDRYGLGQ